MLALSWFVAVLEIGAALAAEPATATGPVSTDDLHGHAEHFVQADRIERAITALDDDHFSVRAAAERRLLEIGAPALPALRTRREGASHEVSFRVIRIADRISQAALSADFERLAAQEVDFKIDLDQGMWLVARIGNPLVRREELSGQLDALASAVRQQLGDDVDPAKADPAQVVEALRAALFGDEGFKGVMVGESPDNSSLELALRTKRGLPITLSHVVVAVAERLRVPIVGLTLPNHRYMVMYDGSRAPAGFDRGDIIFDPYNGARVVPRETLAQAIRLANGRINLEQYIVPCPKRATLVRMLENLRVDYSRVGQGHKAAEVARYKRILDIERE
ncbi:MAG TPA: transglutaminase-like domain-containing protein [Pirellulales bacterium]|nr:transglutaminase-like domain-containing protein [Pirellulales bacterium]